MSSEHKPVMRCISQDNFQMLENTLKSIYSDDSRTRSLPGTPADEMQHSFHLQENIYMEPHPDYLNDDCSDSYYGIETDQGNPDEIYPPPEDDDDDMVQAKKLINPCIDSKERRNLHKELLLNHKLGKNVLEKSELEKVMQQRKQTQRKKEWEEQKSTKRSSLELMLEERKNRISQDEEKDEKIKHANEELANRPEYLKVHAKIHARVAANAANTKLE